MRMMLQNMRSVEYLTEKQSLTEPAIH